MASRLSELLSPSRAKILGFGFAILALIDRIHFATVAQWREDQATTLWLGLHAFKTGLPVGLISSTRIPNPNGMPLLAVVLARLPNLLVVSTFLGCLQAAALAAFCRAAVGAGMRFWAVFLPLVTALVMRGTGGEFCNHWTLTTIVIACAAVAVDFARRPKGWHVPVAAALILLCPAVYLIGIVNAILFSAIALGLLAAKARHTALDRRLVRQIATSIAWVVLIALAFYFATWRPFFHHVGKAELSAAAPDPVDKRLTELWNALTTVPDWIGQWATANHAFTPSILDDATLTPVTLRWGRFAMLLFKCQAVVALAALAAGLARAAERMFRRIAWGQAASSNQRMAANSVAPMCIALTLWIGPYILSPLLGGPSWHRGRRLDQAQMCAPFFLFAIFAGPFFFLSWRPVERTVRAATVVVAVVVSITSSIAGVLVVRNHLAYQGNVLSQADVPLIQKQRAISFIAEDWRANADKGADKIAVDYDLVGRWPWVPTFGERIGRYYPAPMTVGRSFDFELERRFGLHNVQEGVQHRSVGKSRYVISYAFRSPPPQLPANSTHYFFGRLRVSVAASSAGR